MKVFGLCNLGNINTQSFLNPWDVSLAISEYFNVDFPFKDRHSCFSDGGEAVEIWVLAVGFFARFHSCISSESAASDFGCLAEHCGACLVSTQLAPHRKTQKSRSTPSNQAAQETKYLGAGVQHSSNSALSWLCDHGQGTEPL